MESLRTSFQRGTYHTVRYSTVLLWGERLAVRGKREPEKKKNTTQNHNHHHTHHATTRTTIMSGNLGSGSGGASPYDDHNDGGGGGVTPLPDFNASNIRLSTVAPAFGIPSSSLSAGPGSAHLSAGRQPDYLDYDQKGRGIVSTMFTNSGISYVLGVSLGGLYGLREGLLRTPSSRWKVKLNSVLNHCGRHGSGLGNMMGSTAILYSLYEGVADTVSGWMCIAGQVTTTTTTTAGDDAPPPPSFFSFVVFPFAMILPAHSSDLSFVTMPIRETKKKSRTMSKSNGSLGHLRTND